MSIIKIGLIGAGGKMGKIIISLIEQNPELNLTAAFEHPNSRDLGMPVNLRSNSPSELNYIPITLIEEILSSTSIDVCIDFSHPDCTKKWAPFILQHKIPIVIATTGLSDQFHEEMQKVAKEHRTSALISTNMAFGMNLFIKTAKQLASYIPNWDIEIIEKHHHHKLDSPSGTALTLANEIKQIIAKESDSEEIFTFGRGKGKFPRKIGSREIGIHAIRAGDIVGEHTIIFAGSGERLEFTHRAHSRVCFGEGALNAAKFLLEHKLQGKLYQISDVVEYAGRK
ncbi:MAG: 4-hydroxy-tetrahydrodipicolinate reductase [Candidatus Lokiarchaeota archaeon]|nr:4-hydroxy-tetrahydrodipicolinate reductase [Candidatus Lokiarchaeota archaeon]